MPITCKDWNWIPVPITDTQKQTLLTFPSTIKREAIKEVKVSTLDVRGLRQDVVHVSWIHISQPELNVDLFFSHEKYNSILKDN